MFTREEEARIREIVAEIVQIPAAMLKTPRPWKDGRGIVAENISAGTGTVVRFVDDAGNIWPSRSPVAKHRVAFKVKHDGYLLLEGSDEHADLVYNYITNK